ncbi:hypothetical protein H9K76_13785 [Diaphorobacter ruginosibacter]|uniref:Uncharacterized protein n=1 Tax=Diaphorobacter ruginosibacter TaxID=1715720 RepID=A0A7G9RJC5_9BURK|nr:hypothetical protein [Diaphorobacter ruginosibacter]QNN55700.1 hypothetical protein H9K76_13785 [Diaphorobacter ruginosibacter]
MANRSFSYEEAFGPSPSKPKSNTPVEKQTFSYEDAFSPPAESRSRSIGAALNDTVIEVANAAAGGLSSAANFLLPGNSLSKFVDKNIVEDGESTQSVLIKAGKQKFRTEMENAKGVGDEVAAIGNYVVNTPCWPRVRPLVLLSFRARRSRVEVRSRGVGADANAVTRAQGRAGWRSCGRRGHGRRRCCWHCARAREQGGRHGRAGSFRRA